MADRTCFVIGPIGEPGSEIRQNADMLMNYIVRPALEPYHITVFRGDHRAEANQIDTDVIKSVQEADVCIVDLTGLNPNVMYEFGRRDETGKPVIVLRTKGQPLPVDLATRRCIEYDFHSVNVLQAVEDTKKQVRSFIESMIADGFAGDSATPTLRDIGTIMQRLERKIDKIASEGVKTTGGNGGGNGGGTIVIGENDTLPEGITPQMAFRMGRQKNDIHMMEVAMHYLQQQMDLLTFIDQYAEIAAGRGSQVAGEMLIAHAQEFMDSDMSFKKKYELLGFMISYAGRRDEEERIMGLVESMCEQLITEVKLSDGAIPESKLGGIHNQKNRLYYGMYANTRDPEWLDKADSEISQAISYDPEEGSYYYNLCTILVQRYKQGDDISYIERACQAIGECLRLDRQDDDDHLKMAYKLYRKMERPEADEVMAKLKEKFPAVAQYVLMDPEL